MTEHKEAQIVAALQERISQRGDPAHPQGGVFDDSQPPKKSAARVEAQIAAGQIARVPAPPNGYGFGSVAVTVA